MKERTRYPRELLDSRLIGPVFNDSVDSRLQTLASNDLPSDRVQQLTDPIAHGPDIQNAVNDALTNSGLVDFLESPHEQMLDLKRKQEEAASTADRLVGNCLDPYRL